MSAVCVGTRITSMSIAMLKQKREYLLRNVYGSDPESEKLLVNMKKTNEFRMLFDLPVLNRSSHIHSFNNESKSIFTKSENVPN